jgi:hypothetical protein
MISEEWRVVRLTSRIISCCEPCFCAAWRPTAITITNEAEPLNGIVFMKFVRPIYFAGMGTQTIKRSRLYSSRNYRPNAGNAAGSDGDVR